MTSANRMDGDLDIDVASLFGSLWRKKFRILLLSTVAAAATAAAVLAIDPKYMAETRVLIETRESVYTRPDTGNIDEQRPVLDSEGVLSQVELMGSADVLSKVADELKLIEREEFDPNNRSISETIMALLGRSPELGLKDALIARMREKLNIYRVEDSRVIVVGFSSKDPKLAALVPQAIANTYLVTQQAAKLETDTSATDWLEPVIKDLSDKVKEAEAKVSSYRAENDILDGQNNSVLATQQLSELSTELTRVKSTRAQAEAKAQSVRALLDSGASIDSVPEVLASGLMQRLREQQVQLNSQIADLSTTLLDNHPRIKGLRSQLADMDGQIRKEVQKILKSLETEARTASLREKDLVASLNGLKAESSRVGDDEVGLRALEREATAQRDLLESYLTRYREASSRKNSNYQVPDARIFAKAEVPSEPYFPKFIPTVGAAFFGALLLFSMATLLRELFSGRAFRQAAYAPPVAAPTVAAVAAAAPAGVAAIATQVANDVATVSPEPESPAVDNELTIASVAARLVDEGHTCAVIVSPEGDEASAASVLLARNLADQGLKTVLLDLTANSAAARPMTDGLALPGITNLLTGTATFANILHNDVYSNAHVVPTGTADAARAAKAVERLPMVINALVSAYDIVLVECGPSTVAGIKRLVVPGSTIIVSIVNPESRAALSSMTELISAGYEDLILVSPVGVVSPEPLPGRSVA
ncbi:MAG: Wzz/FepE/Etk N-terminal domain-containing protein [Rhizobiaceae bacterium]